MPNITDMRVAYGKATEVTDLSSLTNLLSLERSLGNHPAFILVSTDGIVNVLKYDFSTSIVTGEFARYFDPVTKIQTYQTTGLIGSMFGMSVYTDHFLPEEERFIDVAFAKVITAK